MRDRNSPKQSKYLLGGVSFCICDGHKVVIRIACEEGSRSKG